MGLLVWGRLIGAAGRDSARRMGKAGLRLQAAAAAAMPAHRRRPCKPPTHCLAAKPQGQALGPQASGCSGSQPASLLRLLLVLLEELGGAGLVESGVIQPGFHTGEALGHLGLQGG